MAKARTHFVATGNLTESAEVGGVSRYVLRKDIQTSKIAAWDGRRWRFVEREVRVITQGRERWIKVGFGAASLVGSHNEAVKRFLRTNEVSVLNPFMGQSAADLSGRKYPLETRPNVLYRLAARGSEGFEQVYRRTA